MFVRRWMAGCSAVFVGALLGSTPWEVRAATQQIDWAALNPAFEAATFVNDARVCGACHEDALRAFGDTPHARAFRVGKMPAQGECESCHGPRSKHVENPGRELAWAKLSAAQQSTVCMQCHEGGARMGWKGGAHLSSGVSCSSCHSVMAERSERVLLVRPRVEETCYTCHGEARAQMSKSSHHPVREGRMDCASCHNAHGSTPSLMRTATVNETCVSCHAEKRGPFLWEHAPVRESCANCHEPHGSSNRNLLTRKDPFLCLQCHSYGGHVNLPRYNRVSSPYGSGCVNCHVTTHGSNHPSGAKQTR
ncbi:MAG: DmsE family decaheme c-type cytochrome [Gemmatimonadetes bacterium]|nr:DmsE family decaheme c-type cytochrome [Gemmatimonadota bacterium]